MFSHQRHTRIEWAHCDPAGIVYFPRYAELFDGATVALFEAALGARKRTLLERFGALGFPVVATGSDFHAPSRYGDDVVITSTIESVGRTSFRIAHRLLREDGSVAIDAHETRVWVAPATGAITGLRATPLPAEVRAALTQAPC